MPSYILTPSHTFIRLSEPFWNNTYAPQHSSRCSHVRGAILESPIVSSEFMSSLTSLCTVHSGGFSIRAHGEIYPSILLCIFPVGLPHALAIRCCLSSADAAPYYRSDCDTACLRPMPLDHAFKRAHDHASLILRYGPFSQKHRDIFRSSSFQACCPHSSWAQTIPHSQRKASRRSSRISKNVLETTVFS